VLSTVEVSTSTSLGPSHCTRAPSVLSSITIASTLLIRGTLCRITSSEVSRHAARIGSAPFLLPAGVIVPDSGTPPSITNFSTGIDPDCVDGGREPPRVAGDGGAGGPGCPER